MPPKIPAKPTKSSTKSTKSATSAKSAKSAKPTNPTPSKTKSAAMKRPRSISPDSSASGDDSSSAPAPAVDPMEIFRRHFESRFEAIEVAPVVPSTSSNKRKSTAIDEGSDVEGPDCDEDEDSLDSDEEEDWEEEQVLEVVHNDSANLVPSIKESKKGLRAFMKSTAKSEITEAPTTKKSKKGGKNEEDGEEANEQENLHNDLALQRLLAESHLLDKDSGSLEATGAQRLKAQQLRIEALGGKKIEQKMGMRMKQGIEAKKTGREKKRRREAKESGVVLEKERKVKKVRARIGGVGDASVGKWKGGALVLSKKDVGDIVGRKQGGKGKGGKRR